MRKLEHAELEAFRRLIRGEASRDQAMLVVRHLLAGCGICRERSAAAQEEVGAPDLWSYDAAFDRAEECLVGRAAPRPARLRLVRAGQRR